MCEGVSLFTWYDPLITEWQKQTRYGFNDWQDKESTATLAALWANFMTIHLTVEIFQPGPSDWYCHPDASVDKSKSSSDLFDKRQLRCGIYSKNSTLITQNGNYTSKFQHQPNTHLFFLAVVGLKKLLPESFLILFLRLITQQLLNIEAVSSLYFFVGYSQRFVCHGDVHIRWCHVHTLYCIMPLPSSR